MKLQRRVRRILSWWRGWLGVVILAVGPWFVPWGIIGQQNFLVHLGLVASGAYAAWLIQVEVNKKMLYAARNRRNKGRFWWSILLWLTFR
jgi:hypothetical protein